MNRLKKALIGLAILCGSTAASAQNTPHFTKDQYQKALWMTTRFYGAQRMGDGPNWLIADYEPQNVDGGIGFKKENFVKGKSYIKDADGDYDLTGGWYDCGDFVLFGQTFYYSAYMLLLGYSEFPSGFDDFYSTDYNGYITSGDYTWEGKKGKPNGIPDILDEAKYATDYIMKAFRDEKTFYYQKGDGDADHKIWCTSPTKSALSISNGGELEGSRKMGKASGNVTSMAALGGAALAVMARVYAKFDPDYARQCLEKAKVAYNFVQNTAKGNAGAGGFYGSKPKYVTDEVIFYTEMYRATNDASYLKAAEAQCSWLNAKTTYDYNFSLCYNNTEDLACYLIASTKESSFATKAKEALDYYVNTMYKPGSGYFLNKKNDGWGVLRYPANQAFVYALYDKLTGVEEMNPYSLTSIEYIMGNNSNKFSYIVGFGDKHPFYPHHRNFYRTDNNSENNLPKITKDYKYIQLGYLVGGSLKDGYYVDSEKEYTFSEGGIDYNAGLVCALGYINSKISPIDVNKFGHPVPSLGDKPISICGTESIELDSKVEPNGKTTYTWKLDGKIVSGPSTTANKYIATKPGEYTCELDSAGQWTTSGSVIISGELPELNLGDDITLCNPSVATLNASVEANVSYKWFKDGNEIADATEPELNVYTAGVYKCEISTSNCDAKSDEITVESNLPTVADARSTSTGKVTLKVLSEGEFEWYDTAEGGTPLGTGNTFTTNISANKAFYVQDAGAMTVTVGPSKNDFTGEAVNWGNIGANFTASKPMMINGLKIYVQSVYNKGNATVSAKLTHNGNDKNFTSAEINLQDAGVYEVSFPTPIEISEAGNYTLTCSGNFAVGFFANGKNYSEYKNQGDAITFTGATQGQAENGAFPGLFDWNITTGSGCGRAMVMAIFDPNNIDETSADMLTDDMIRFYPNPVENTLFINLSTLDNAVRANIYSTSRLCKTASLKNAGKTAEIDLSNLNSGVYLIEIVTENKILTGKIIKK